MSQHINPTVKAVGVLSLVSVLSGCALLFGPNLGPLQPLEVEKTSAQIERGQYLFNHVSACVDCHSKRDWSRYAGPLVAGTEGAGGALFGESLGLPGNVYAKNITPAALGTWSDAEVLRAMTEGVNKDGVALFPIMPYQNFSQLTEEDAKSIIAYLRTLKPIARDIPKRDLHFPVNFIVNTIPQQTRLATTVNKADSVQYGKYLTTIAGCEDCHTQRTKTGKRLEELAFAGGVKFPMPAGVVRSANITPDSVAGIGTWNKDDFVGAFKKHAGPDAPVAVGEKDMNTMMPWTFYAHMKESDLAAIYDYLRTVKPVSKPVEKFTPAS